MIPIAIGFDERESATFHVLEQSIIDKCSLPVAIIPLHKSMLRNFDGQRDGTNAFIYSRFLVPELMDYTGWALYLDSDMMLRTDLACLWDTRDESKAVMVVKHAYETITETKLIGTPMEARNESYPRKNWSSMVLWNCGHERNKILTREFVEEAGGRRLHRFEWLDDSLIGEIPPTWNHLVGEYLPNKSASLVHWTLGAPGFQYYKNSEHSAEWHRYQREVTRMDELNESRAVTWR